MTLANRTLLGSCFLAVVAFEPTPPAQESLLPAARVPTGVSGSFGHCMAAGERVFGSHPALAVASVGPRWSRTEVRVYDAVDGREVYSVSCEPESGSVDGLVFLEDLDGDEIPDWACATSGFMGKDSFAGLVEIRSGATGRPLARVEPADGEFAFGLGIRSCADRDGDGHADLLISMREGNRWSGGKIRIVSTRTFQTILSKSLPVDPKCYAGPVVEVSSESGCRVIYPILKYPNAWIDRIRCVSLDDARVIWERESLGKYPSLGSSSPSRHVLEAGCPARILFGLPRYAIGGEDGSLLVLSEETGQEVRSLSGSDEQFGSGFAVLRDRRSNTASRLAVAVSRLMMERPYLVLFDLPAYQRSAVIDFPVSALPRSSDDELEFARDVVNAGDIDADGHDDLAVAGWNPWNPSWVGYLMLFSGRDGKFLRRISPQPKSEPGPSPR